MICGRDGGIARAQTCTSLADHRASQYELGICDRLLERPPKEWSSGLEEGSMAESLEGDSDG